MIKSNPKEAQARFDAQYVSGLEIRKRLRIAGCTLTLARQRGSLPEPITVGGNVYVWERGVVESYLLVWEKALATRRDRNFAIAMNRLADEQRNPE